MQLIPDDCSPLIKTGLAKRSSNSGYEDSEIDFCHNVLLKA